MSTSPADILQQLRDRQSLHWIGLMSGTSCDGIDVALVKVSERTPGQPTAKLLRGETLSFPGNMTRALRADLDGSVAVERAAAWDARLGESFAHAAARWVESGDVRADAIALSGHTFVHRPAASPPFTLQLGDPARVARATGCPVVAGFRACDVARGGEGAPLVPAGDRILFADAERNVAVLNIGGISNVTWLPAGGGTPVAADCGPGNLVLDTLVSTGSDGALTCDTDGAVAADGHADHVTVERWLDHPFFRADRRSTGREEFGEAWVREHEAELTELSLPDRLATAVHWIARGIARCLNEIVGGATPDRLLVGGGGAHHRPLVAAVAAAVGCTAEPLQQGKHGVNADLREAAAFALLGHEWLHGRPGSFPETTGCHEPGPLGSLWLA